MPLYSYVPKQNVAFSYPLLQMWFSSMRFVAQQNNILCCVWFLFNDALCTAAKITEGQLSMDENARPRSGCITCTKEVKEYLFGNQGAGVMESSEQGQGRCWAGRSWQGQQWEQRLQESWGMGATSAWSQHLQNSIQTRPPHKSTNKNQCVPVMEIGYSYSQELCVGGSFNLVSLYTTRHIY